MKIGTVCLYCLLTCGCVPARPAVVEPAILSERPPHTPFSSAVSSAAPVRTEPASAPRWEVDKGRMLREQMTDWAASANYNLIWNAQNDYELRGSATFQGEFIDAVKTLFAALQANGLALRVTIYQGNKVMEVSEH